MIGPFKKATGGYDHVLVAIDKFTKWIEYKPISKLTAAKAIEFIEEIMHRFGVPSEIITDLGTNFAADSFFEFCKRKGILVRYASMKHPRANGQVERANGMILHGLKPAIFDKLKPYEGKWLRELPYVIWGLRTKPSKAISNNTPFYMVYWSEAVLPADLIHGAPRIAFRNIPAAEQSRTKDVDLVEGERLHVALKAVKYQQALKRYYDKNAKPAYYHEGDLVLKRKTSSARQSKLSAPWEGPYVIKEVLGKATFKLCEPEGRELPNT